jgi:putative ABC transport system substrate-binding protein
MRRREFITLLGGAAAAWPRGAGAQQAGSRRIGLLETGAPSPARVQLWETLRQRLRELGYLEGQNIAFEHRRRRPILPVPCVGHVGHLGQPCEGLERLL